MRPIETLPVLRHIGDMADRIAPVLSTPRPREATRDKLEGGRRLVMATPFEPAGDQPQAIDELARGVLDGEQDQVLLGATGTGKTFTMAKVIEETQRPAIILAPNKTLAAQLYGEFKHFFPENAVEYFVSYYDYYQPEAYVPRSDTYIEKEAQINEQIDRMRHSATRALLERDDVIIVASVSCIYGIGAAETYSAMTQDLIAGESYNQQAILRELVTQQYRRNDAGFARGCFRVRGDSLEIWPAHLEDRAWKLSFFGDELERIDEFDPLTGAKTDRLDRVRVYANSHYVTPRPTLNQAIRGIQEELRLRLDQLIKEGRLLEAQRLAHKFRPRNDPGDRLLQRHRELLALPDGPQTRRAAPHPLRVHPRQRHLLRRREPRHRAPARRHVPRRLPPEVHPGRARLPPALLHGQPPPQVRGMGRHAPPVRLCLRHPRPMGARAHRRRLHGTGHPPDRPDRSRVRGAPGREPGRRSHGRGP